MRARERIDRRGPGLIASMTRSAVLASRPGGPRMRSLRTRRLSTDRAAEASERYQQLCDLLEDGILTAPEFEAGVGRLTSALTGARHLRLPWGRIPPGSLGDEGSGRSH